MILRYVLRNFARRKTRAAMAILGVFCTLALLTAVHVGLESVAVSYIDLVSLHAGKADIVIRREGSDWFRAESFDAAESRSGRGESAPERPGAAPHRRPADQQLRRAAIRGPGRHRPGPREGTRHRRLHAVAGAGARDLRVVGVAGETAGRLDRDRRRDPRRRGRRSSGGWCFSSTEGLRRHGSRDGAERDVGAGRRAFPGGGAPRSEILL